VSDLFSLDDLPNEARELLDEAERDVIAIRDKAERQADETQLRANRQIEDIKKKADKTISDANRTAQEQVEDRQKRLLAALRPLQQKYAKEGKLDEALAIRERIRALKTSAAQVRPNPGTLAGEDATPGRTELFDVTGSIDGTIWGTDVYTGDSSLAMAAIHAGVLNDGQRGVVRVTFVDSLNVAFTSTTRNGITSHGYGPYPTAYRVERV